MIYYFSAPESMYKEVKKHLKSKDASFLMSFAGSLSQIQAFLEAGQNFMIDSGAFSAWNSGKEISLEEYFNFCKTLPDHVYKINLDVIPKTGSTQKEKLKCIEESFENFLFLSDHLENVLPVHHYGEDISWAKKFLEYTDYICISPANDTHENIKREYFNYVFGNLPENVKTHALGYSSLTGIRLYPFYSVDSISYKSYEMRGVGLYFREEDKKLITITAKEFAKLNGRFFSDNIKMVEQRDIVVDLGINSINSILRYFEHITEEHKTRDFSYLKSQLKLF